MSIIVSVKVNDGIILGADSATQIWGEIEGVGPGVAQVYYNSRKIFRLANLPIAVAVYGIGNIKERSVQNIIAEYSEGLEGKKKGSVDEISRQLWAAFNEAYTEAFNSFPQSKRPGLGFFVAGYSDNSNLSDEREWRFPDKPEITPVRPPEQYGASWRGISIPFSRLHKGFDPRCQNDILALGLTDDKKDEIQQIFKKYESPVVFHGMPLSVAVQYAQFILDTTINLVYFEAGPPTCGHPVSIIAIPNRGEPKWIRKIKLEAKGDIRNDDYS